MKTNKRMVMEFPAVPANDFGAQVAAEAWLDARGFSYGSCSVGGPQAIWYGDCRISKWRNLNAAEKQAAHATMDGPRGGTVRITLRAHAPAEAVAAFNRPDQ
ncbi:MAG: hypothetical protein K2X55_24420 [Burkholderiaceae bacterium]|nr:hypothetical protein [Burkholderiaceae bacterium]